MVKDDPICPGRVRSEIMTGKQSPSEKKDTTIVPTGCLHDCGGRCVLKAHVREGKIIRIETDNGEEPQIRACLRGRSYRQRVYHPDRLKYPLRRIGQRGEGRFERISWDEALDQVSSEMKRIKERYGNSAILLAAGSGNMGLLHNLSHVIRLREGGRGISLFCKIQTFSYLPAKIRWARLLTAVSCSLYRVKIIVRIQ